MSSTSWNDNHLNEGTPRVRKEKVVKKLVAAMGVAAAAVLCVVGCCPMCSGEKEGSGAQARAAGAMAQPQGAPKVQTTCLVMGGKINKALHVDHQGKRIYACCPQCLPELQKDPAKYVARLEEQGVSLDRVDMR